MRFTLGKLAVSAQNTNVLSIGHSQTMQEGARTSSSMPSSRLCGSSINSRTKASALLLACVSYLLRREYNC